MARDPMTVAVLGLGLMGQPMALNLLQAGLRVVGWNRTRERLQPLCAQPGGTAATTPAEALRGADVVLSMLADGPVTHQVLIESRALGEAAPGTPWLQMGTIGLQWTERLAGEAERAGLIYVDAPVLGTKAPAEKGELVILAAGPSQVKAKVAPVLDALGRKTLWLGAVGAGSRLKLVVNHWIGALVANLSETLALAQALGADPEAFLALIDGNPVGSPYAQLKGKAMLSGALDPSFPLALALKDVHLVLEAAQAANHELPLALTVAELFEAAVRRGLGDKDMAALYELLRPGTGGAES